MADRLPMLEYLRTTSTRVTKTIRIADGEDVVRTTLEGSCEDTVQGVAALAAAQKQEIQKWGGARKQITGKLSGQEQFFRTPEGSAALILAYADEEPVEPAPKKGRKRGGIDPALTTDAVASTGNGEAGS